MGISGGKTPITHVGYMDPIGEANVAPGAKKGLISLVILANDGCTFKGDKENLVVWNKDGKKIIHALRDVNDEGSMWETSLQALKGSMVSDVETNLINLRENNDVHVNADMLQLTREMWDLHERLGHPSNDVLKVILDHRTSPDIRVTSRNVDNAERWFGPCTACLEGKMIAREQARVWGGGRWFVWTSSRAMRYR